MTPERTDRLSLRSGVFEPLHVHVTLSANRILGANRNPEPFGPLPRYFPAKPTSELTLIGLLLFDIMQYGGLIFESRR